MDSPDFYYTLTTKPDGSEKETLVYGNSADSTVTAVDSSESSFSGHLDVSQLSFPDLCGEPCVLYDDVAELEWLSNFVEESSFTSEEDIHKLNLISGVKIEVSDEEARKDDSGNHTDTDSHQHPIFRSEITVPGKTRSKRERSSPCKWDYLLLRNLAHTPSPATSEASETGSLPLNTGKNSLKVRLKCLPLKRKCCLHCGIEKTPQWRNGPMGPKTLCNACGVRFRSGRLVPEYRPADSPTFVPSKHSNSHRKVLEMRRQREMQKRTRETQFSYASMFDVSCDADADADADANDDDEDDDWFGL